MLNNGKKHGKNTPLNGYCGQKNRNSKIGLRYDIRDIPISLHAKIQGNRTIRLGEKQ